MRRRGERERGFAMLLLFVMAAAVAIMLYRELPRVAFEGVLDHRRTRAAGQLLRAVGAVRVEHEHRPLRQRVGQGLHHMLLPTQFLEAAGAVFAGEHLITHAVILRAYFGRLSRPVTDNPPL